MRAISFLLMLTLCSPAHAQWPRGWGIACFEMFKSLGYFSLVENYENRTLLPAGPELPNPAFQINIGKRLGFGMTAAAFEAKIDGISEVAKVLGEDTPVAVKILHHWKRGKKLWSKRSVIDEEAQVWKIMFDHLTAFEKDPEYPANPAWDRGRLPTLPMFGPYETQGGPVLVKAIVRGKTLSDLWAEYRPNKVEDLPAEMRAGLDDIYHFAKVAARLGGPIKGNGLVERDKLTLDINPTNLVWVSDPIQMKALGFKRPGFVTYELSYIPENFYSHLPTSLSYQEFVVNFIRSRAVVR